MFDRNAKLSKSRLERLRALRFFLFFPHVSPLSQIYKGALDKSFFNSLHFQIIHVSPLSLKEKNKNSIDRKKEKNGNQIFYDQATITEKGTTKL